uniref:Phytochrome central region domain-containing protein n=1 Tax=Eutreptiella gymnastica TaxID=73025 RepID=A0A7S1NI69_9EUGL
MADEDADLTHCCLRPSTMLPHHKLGMDGLQATLSWPLVVDTQPWGFILCRNYSPTYVPFLVRKQCRLAVTALEAFLMEHSEKLALHRILGDLPQAEPEECMLDPFSLPIEPVRHLQVPVKPITDSKWLKDIIRCSGAAVLIGTEIHLDGKTPLKSELRNLFCDMMCRRTRQLVTTRLLETCASTKMFVDKTMHGCLAVLSFDPEVGIFWFRCTSSNACVQIDRGPARTSSGMRQILPWTKAEQNLARTFFQGIQNFVNESGATSLGPSLHSRSDTSLNLDIGTNRVRSPRHDEPHQLRSTCSQSLTSLCSDQTWGESGLGSIKWDSARFSPASSSASRGRPVHYGRQESQGSVVSSSSTVSASIVCGQVRINVQVALLGEGGSTVSIAGPTGTPRSRHHSVPGAVIPLATHLSIPAGKVQAPDVGSSFEAASSLTF